MNATTLTRLLEIAAVLHLGLVWAGLTMPKAVNLQAHLKSLPVFIRRLFYVYYSFIGLMLVGFGILTGCFAAEMASGEPVARALCVLLTVFWGIRLIAAAFVFDVRPYLTTWRFRLGYQAINLVFIYLLAVYAFTAWKGGGI